MTGEDDRCEYTGRRIQNRRTENILLHHLILGRMGLERPTPKHIAGHMDDNSMNCRRNNLDWVTHGGNVQASWRARRKK